MDFELVSHRWGWQICSGGGLAPIRTQPDPNPTLTRPDPARRGPAGRAGSAYIICHPTGDYQHMTIKPTKHQIKRHRWQGWQIM